MKRSDKILKRKERAKKRKQKRIDELLLIKKECLSSNASFTQARNIVRRKFTFECEMGYSDCNARGYCNGDC